MTRPADLRALVERATPGPETYLTTRALHEHEFARHQLRAALADLAPALLALWEAADGLDTSPDHAAYDAVLGRVYDALATLRRLEEP